MNKAYVQHNAKLNFDEPSQLQMLGAYITGRKDSSTSLTQKAGIIQNGG